MRPIQPQTAVTRAKPAAYGTRRECCSYPLPPIISGPENNTRRHQPTIARTDSLLVPILTLLIKFGEEGIRPSDCRLVTSRVIFRAGYYRWQRIRTTFPLCAIRRRFGSRDRKSV